MSRCAIVALSVFHGPPAPPSKAWGHRYYQTGHGHCEDDLKNIVANPQQKGITGHAPYCTDNPTAPPMKGEALIF
jgi:hypothetical protein